MIVSKTTVNNTTVNSNNNSVTFTDKPVESQIPVSQLVYQNNQLHQ